jgi:hypothetical protein
MSDRQAGAWIDLQQLQDPMGLYARTYRAKVVAQSDDEETVDLRPDDPALPPMSKIPLRHGLPGARVAVAIGSYLQVGWDDGRPDRPYASLWSRDTHVVKVTLVADRTQLGGRDATEAFVCGTSRWNDESKMLQGLQQAFTMLAGAATAGPLSPLEAGIQQALQSLTEFLAKASAASGYLSPKVFGK